MMYLTQKQEDGTSRMTIPAHWLVWTAIMVECDKTKFIRSEYHAIYDFPGVTVDYNFLQFVFDNDESAVQFKLIFL